ncbi:Fic family protein [Pannonibacter indicus]|uniref:Fic family protein n=1 Tax=Pannonibacter indicus TaxID=466044 RepID=UPI003918F160
MKPLAKAREALARYDQMLKNLHNSEILLAPLRNKEAVISSRIEGTVSTLDEVLRYEADKEGDADGNDARYRGETMEVFLYAPALRQAQKSMEDGAPLSKWLLRSIHAVLLGFGRGAHLSPGDFKDEQNYLVDKVRRKVMFVPASPEQLAHGLDNLISYISTSDDEELIKTAVSHVEFEALHPFKDGNGRIGRMLITLTLWQSKLISAPHFYISRYFEIHRDEYIDRMREVSRTGAWTDWVIFFLDALASQAYENLQTAENIRNLYEDMKLQFREELSSQWSINALDFMFSRPVFRNNVFTSRSGIPAATAQRFTKALVESGMLKTLEAPAGRRPGLYAFEPLLSVVRE